MEKQLLRASISFLSAFHPLPAVSAHATHHSQSHTSHGALCLWACQNTASVPTASPNASPPVRLARCGRFACPSASTGEPRHNGHRIMGGRTDTEETEQ